MYRGPLTRSFRRESCKIEVVSQSKIKQSGSFELRDIYVHLYKVPAPRSPGLPLSTVSDLGKLLRPGEEGLRPVSLPCLFLEDRPASGCWKLCSSGMLFSGVQQNSTGLGWECGSPEHVLNTDRKYGATWIFPHDLYYLHTQSQTNVKYLYIWVSELLNVKTANQETIKKRYARRADLLNSNN